MSAIHRICQFLIVVALTVTGSLLGTASASAAGTPEGAQPSDSGCGYGQFCVFDESGTIIFATSSDWSGSGKGIYGGYSYFNNGMPQPEYDHIELTYLWPLSDGGWWTGHKCIHYGHPDGLGDFDQKTVYIKKIRWRGECTQRN